MRLPLFLLSIFLYLPPFSGLRAQNTTVQDSFRNYLETQESLSFVSLYFDLVADADQLFPIAEENLLAASKAEKRKFYRLILSIGAKAKQESIKKQTISYMLQAYEEEQRPGYGIYYLERLTIFNRQLFDKGMKTRLRTLLRNSRGTKKDIKQLILLVGFLQMKREKEYLRSNFLETFQAEPKQKNPVNYFYSKEWVAYLALARMGDRSAIKHVETKFKEQTSHWNLCRLFADDFDYVRQEATHKLLIDLALKRERLYKMDLLSTPCNFYLLNLLLESVKNYSGELVYYPRSEDAILEWFRNHRKLVINRDVF